MSQRPAQSRPSAASRAAFQTYVKNATSRRISGRRAMPLSNEAREEAREMALMMRIVGCRKCSIGSAAGTLYRAGKDDKTGKMTYLHAQCKPPVTVSVEGVILPSDQIIAA